MDAEQESQNDPSNSARAVVFPLIVALSLGLAPFTPEPHLLGKLRWVFGGARGMTSVDWFDLAMHGAPWLWLLWVLAGLPRATDAVRRGLVFVGLLLAALCLGWSFLGQD